MTHKTDAEEADQRVAEARVSEPLELAFRPTASLLKAGIQLVEAVRPGGQWL